MKAPQKGQPLPELVDARLDKEKKTLTLFIRQNGIRTYRRLDMTRYGAGLNRVNSSGQLLFTRAVTVESEEEVDGVTFTRVIRTFCGLYNCRRKLAEALIFVLWGKEMSLDNWPEPDSFQQAKSVTEDTP